MAENEEKKRPGSKIHAVDSGAAEAAESSDSAGNGAAETGAGAPDEKWAKLQAELEDLRQTLLRRQADFENYRKRIERERGEDARRGAARVMEGLLTVLDGFERALAAHREPAYEDYRKGFELIYRQLLDDLTRQGLERIDPTGKPFDPHRHQAVERVESADHEDGVVLGIFQPGYLFHGKVLRPALVRVATHPTKTAGESGGEPAPTSTRMVN